MSTWTRSLLSAVALMALAGCAGPGGDYELRLLHLNDLHARYDEAHKYGGVCKDKDRREGNCLGGMARIATVVEQAREEDDAVLFLNAGDNFQGTLYYTHYKGKATAEMLEMVKPDAMVLGNHEFDDGPKVLGAFIDAVSFPVLSANLDTSHEPALQGKVKPFTLLQVGGETVGVFGLTTTATTTTSSPGASVAFADEIQSAMAMVADLESRGVNKIIALTHMGYARDKELAAAVDGLDIVVGGDSHTLLSKAADTGAGPYPTVVSTPSGAPALVVQAKEYGQYLGDLTVAFNAEGVAIAWKGEPLKLTSAIAQDEAVQARVEALAEPLHQIAAVKVGEAKTMLKGDRTLCRFQECAFGNLIADAMLAGAKGSGAQIAFQNSGGIRASIPAGPVTMGQVLSVLPFSNTLATFKLKGVDIRAVLENAVSAVHNPEGKGTGRFLQVAGLRFTYSLSRPVGQRVISVEVREADGRFTSLRPERLYHGVTNNFIRNGGDDFTMLKERAIDAYDFGPNLEIVVADYISAHTPVAPKTEGRIRELK